MHDAIISSIYNAHDNADIMWKGQGPTSVCSCHCIKECLTVQGGLKANPSNAGKSEQLPGPECVVLERETHKLLETTG